MPTVLITGASGMVGQACAYALKALDGYRIRLASRRFEHLQSFSESFDKVIINELSDTTDWQAALAGVDYVIHAAARVHVMQEKSADPKVEFFKANVEGTVHLAKQAIKHRVKRLIYISSIKVNGENTPPNKPFTANDNPNPQDFYSQSKYQAELKLQQLAKEQGLEVVIIRPPLIYGPKVKGNLQTLIGWIAKGLPVLIANNHAKRSLVNVDNVASLIILCLTHPNALNQVFLVSDSQDYCLQSLTRQIAEILDKKIRYLTLPYLLLKIALTLLGKKNYLTRLYEPLEIDIEKNKLLLDWQPHHTLKQGFEKIIAPKSIY